MNLQTILTTIPNTGENTDYLGWVIGLVLLGAALLAVFFLLGKKK